MFAQKKPNTLGLYDMCGNVCEMAYQPSYQSLLYLLGGSAFDEKNACSLYNESFYSFSCDTKDSPYDEELKAIYNDFHKKAGFRICRTADSISDETSFSANDVY